MHELFRRLADRAHYDALQAGTPDAQQDQPTIGTETITSAWMRICGRNGPRIQADLIEKFKAV